MYCVVLIVNTYCFALHNQLIGFRNRDELVWLCGANRIFIFLNFIVYRKLQSTQLDRIISKGEVRKGREAGTIHRWVTGVVLLS